jgi:isopropylmalate/homocitrate/citramalate synthase
MVTIIKFNERHLDVDMAVRSDKLGPLCDTVIKEMGLKVQIWQPLIGENAFRHESGIHVHGILNNPLTYEILKPEDLGLAKGEFVIGKHTGKAAVKYFLERNGLTLDDDSLVKLTDLVKETTTYQGPFRNETELINFAKLKGFELAQIRGLPP